MTPAVTVPEGEKIVGLVVWQGRCILALTCGVYELRGDQCVPITLAGPGLKPAAVAPTFDEWFLARNGQSFDDKYLVSGERFEVAVRALLRALLRELLRELRDYASEVARPGLHQKPTA